MTVRDRLRHWLGITDLEAVTSRQWDTMELLAERIDRADSAAVDAMRAYAPLRRRDATDVERSQVVDRALGDKP